VLYERLEQSRQPRVDGAGSKVQVELAAPIGTEILQFERTRGGTGSPDITWNRSVVPTTLELRFDVGLEPAESYTATIDRIAPQAARNLLSLPNISTGADGQVSFKMHSALFPAGDYRIGLEPPDAHASAIEPIVYSLRISD